MRYLGIDLGTTNSLLAEKLEDSVIALTDLIPSVVNLSTNDVGLKMKKLLSLSRHNSNIISSFKVDMHQSSEVPIIASSNILKYIKNYMGNENSAIITVPAYFNNSQRMATKQAAKLAKINVLSLINEPTAAALYYNIIKKLDKPTVVFDLGGGTFDVSVVDTCNGIFDVMATEGLKLGGDNLNNAIKDYLYTKCQAIYHKITPSIDKAIVEISEKAKLHVQHNGTFNIKLCEFKDAFRRPEFTLTPEVYKQLLNDIFGVTIIKLQQVISYLGLTAEDIDIILVGGSTKDPYLIEMISKIKKPLEIIEPDRIVALGASVYSYLYQNNMVKSKVSDITKAIGVKLFNGCVENLIPSNSKLPTTAESKIFFNTKRANKIEVKFYEGNSGIAAQNSEIGSINYSFSTMKEAFKGRILIELRINIDGTVCGYIKEPLGIKKEIHLEI